MTTEQSQKVAERDVSTLYYRNKHLLVLTILVLLIGGFSALTNLARQEDPRIVTRNATILTFWPGASASRIEALINKKIEDNLEEIDEIKKIESTARPGVSSIAIELQDSVNAKNNEEIFSKIRSRLQNIQGQLPTGATVPFLDDKRGATAYTMIFGVTWQGQGVPPLNLLNRVALDIKDKMLNTNNTELVRLFGHVQEEILVTPDKGELAALSMTPKQLANIIEQADSKIAAGQLRDSSHDILIEVDGALTGTQRIEHIPVITSEQGTVLTVGDIAHVTRTYQKPMTQLGIKDGQPIIYIAVRSTERVRVDQWTQAVLDTYKKLRLKYSQQIGLPIIFQQDQYTSARLKELASNLVLGALVVIFIVLVIMGWRAALIVGSVLPLSAAGAIFAFNFFGQSIHQMSIFGMIIAIGLVIDSAIVMTDEVRKSIRIKGMTRLMAMRHSVHHLFAPLLASTFTTVLGFMPIFLLPGNAGDFVGPIAISVILALFFSFFLAMTVIPALATNYTMTTAHAEAPLSWWQVGLHKPKVFNDFKYFTRKAMEQPKRFLLLAMIPSISGFLLIGTMKVEFFPAADRDMFEVQLYLPSSSSLSYTKSVVDVADDAIKKLGDVAQVHWLIGASTPPVYYNQIPLQDNNSAFAHAVITATSIRAANRLVTQVQSVLNIAIPDAKVVVKKFAQGPPADAPVAFRILGPELDTLRILGEKVRAIMHDHPDIVQTRASIEGGQAKLWFDSDEAEVDSAGLSLLELADQFQGNLEGFTGGSVLEDIEELPVRVRLAEAERADMGSVGNLLLQTPTVSGWVAADALGTLVLRPEIAEVTRYNNQRVNNVLGYIRPDAKPVSVATDIKQAIETKLQFPNGYRLSIAGESEQQADAIAGLAIFAPVLLVLMAATIILTFRSVALTLIVFTVAILSVGLGMLSLKIAGYSLGFNPLIGSIGLAGVSINNTIVILAAILGNAKAKQGDMDAIVAETYGCGRHVLSTSLTTIGGFIPLLLFSGGNFWPPLAVVIAGGIGFSLLLAMFFTPIAYRLYATINDGKSTHPNSKLSLR